jgi:hypothetical protein
MCAIYEHMCDEMASPATSGGRVLLGSEDLPGEPRTRATRQDGETATTHPPGATCECCAAARETTSSLVSVATTATHVTATIVGRLVARVRELGPPW